MNRRELLEKAPIATVFLKYALPSIITMCFFGLLLCFRKYLLWW